MTDPRMPCVIEVDLRESRRGGIPAQLGAELCGRSVLARTVEGVQAARRAQSPILLVRREEEAAARKLLGDIPVEIVTHSAPDIARRPRLRRARRWGSEGWRGGLEQTLFVSEAGNPTGLAELYRSRGWHAALIVAAEAAFVDPHLLDQVIEGYLRTPEFRIYLSTAAPGLAGDCFHIEVLEHLRAQGVGAERVLSLRIDDYATNFEDQGFFHPFDEPTMELRGRFTVDSRAALERALSLSDTAFRPGVSRSGVAARIRDALRQSPEIGAGTFPEEIILELGPDEGGAHPARARGISRGDRPAAATSVRAAVVSRIREALAGRDDVLISLGGGYHDPLLAPDFSHQVAALRRAGAFGIHVDTSGAAIDDARAEMLIESGVDVITVELGTPGADGGGSVPPGTPSFAARKRGLDALLAAVGRSREPPFVAIALGFDEFSAPHWESAYEEYFARVSRIVLRSPEGPRGESAPNVFGTFTPPKRRPCVRLATQMRVEYDGRVPLCNRDPEAAILCGDLSRESVAAIWQGERFRAARAAHAAGAWSELGHCGACHSWCRLD